MYISDSDMKRIIRRTSAELADKYPMEANYNSRCTLWSKALEDGEVSEALYNIAKQHYGNLWTYVGD